MKDEFWTVVCERTPHLRMLIFVLSILLVMTVFSIVFTTPGSASHVVAIFDLLLLAVVIPAALYLYWRCERHERKRGDWRSASSSDED